MRGLLVVVLCLLVYNSNLRFTGAYDSLAASLIPFELWLGNGVRLDRYAGFFPKELSYALVPAKQGGLVSLYPIVTPLVVAPLYFPAALSDRFRPDDPTYGSLARIAMEKLCASLLTALSALFVFLTARRRTSERVALAVTLIYALATPSWAISSQALWLHPAAQLLLALALYLGTDREEIGGWRSASLGLVSGLLFANRPQDLFYCAAIAWLIARRAGRRFWIFATTACLVVLVALLYNQTYFPTIVGGYLEYRTPSGGLLRPSLPSAAAIAGLLFSNRGLFTFCPFFLLVPFFVRRSAARREELVALGAAFLASVLFYAAFPDWWAGYTYGPRYLSDGLPALVLLLIAPLEHVRRGWARALLAAAIVYAIALQVIGAFFYPAGDSGYTPLGFWTLRRSSPVLAWRSGPATPHFLDLLAPALTMDGPLPSGAIAALAWSEPPPRTWCVVDSKDVSFRVDNLSDRAWSSFGQQWGIHAVRLLASWYREGESVPFRNADYWLAANLPAGGSRAVTIPVSAPKEAGRYRLNVEPAQFDTGMRLVPLSERGAQALSLEATIWPRGDSHCR